jgi:hypothetical protein
MTCFNGLINWKGGCEAPDGLLLDNVVRVSEVEQFITSDYANVNELIQEKLEFAISNVVIEAIAAFKYQIIPKTILENKRIGYPQETQTLVPALTGQMAGIEIEIPNIDSYFELYISAVETYLNFTGNVVMSIVDTYTGQVLQTFTVASVAGVPVTTYVDLAFKAEKRKRRFAIVYNADTIASYKTTLIGDGDCFGCTGGRYSVGKYINGRAIKYPSAGSGLLANITSITNTAGISAIYNLRCDSEGWLCANRNAMRLPILYRTAEELLFFGLEMAKSERLNSKTNIDRDSLERRMNKAHEDYTSQMAITLGHIKPPGDGVCFTCRKGAQYVTTLP